MKTIYFVRHGESTGNANDIRQGPDTPLSEEGLCQTKLVSDRFETIHIDTILSSTYLRAKDTAEMINKILKKDIIYTDLLIERVKPNKVVNKHKSDPEAVSIDRLHMDNFHNPDFKFEDGEVFAEMKQRALKLISYINTLPEENILCVSHGIFMKMILACVIHGEKLTSYEYLDFYKNISLGNTSITVFKEEQVEEKSIWRLCIWGDIAHLGDTVIKNGDAW